MAILSQQLAQMKKEYDEVINQLNQLKIVNDNLRGVVDGIQAVKAEYEFVENFSLENELRRMEYDIQNLTQLDNLNDSKDAMERINVALNEINRRVAGAENQRSKVKIEALKNNVQAMSAAIAAYADESATAGSGRKSSADQLAGINSATSMLAAQALMEKQKEYEGKIKRTENALQWVKNDANFLSYLNGEVVK